MATINKIQFGDNEYDISVNAENIEGEIPVDLSNYYNKTETEGKIDEKINAIPVNDLLHYKGHLNSEGDLPPAGQPSGYAVNYPVSFTRSMFNDIIFHLNQTDTGAQGRHPEWYTYKNYFFDFVFGSNGQYGNFIIMTDYPEQVKYSPVLYSCSGSYYCAFGVYVEYDENKPVYFARHFANGYQIIYRYNGETATSGTEIKQTSPTLVDTSCYFTPFVYYETYATCTRYNDKNSPFTGYTGTYTPEKLYTNYNGNIKVKLSQAGDRKDPFYLAKENYYWTDGMILCSNGKLVTNETSNKQNDLWAVGDNNDLYRYDDAQGWIELSKSSSGSPIEVKNEYNDSQIDTYSCNYLNKQSDYSLEERIVGTWIDGRPLYRKVIDCGYLPDANTAKPVNHNIENIGIIKTCEGVAFKEDQYLALPFFHISNGIRINASQTQVFITPMTSRTEHYAYAWLEYTKTTDEATINLLSEPVALEEE